ncbi:type II secretion system protein GspN [Leptospira wolffii]|uniref:Type II secretion system protein GspN n=1 Tax=Leptospira wolffii TaxID=409998 RepID=A0A2M9Z9T2_9LEPT|nr:type II secretion system protein GspN [Leptospira wolffii]PJZ65189.1 type II secretion system protein GspN [Leptospira wolffii]
MPRAKKIEEEEIISNEEEEFLTMELEDIPEDPSEEESAPRFTLKQKLILIGTGAFSFVFFLFFLFPYENILRQVLSSSSGGQPSAFFFRELNVSILFGEVSAKSLEISGPSLRIKANQASVSAGLISLLRKKVNGDFEVNGLKIEYDGEPIGSITSLEGLVKVDSLVAPISRFNGAFSLKMPEGKKGNLSNLPELPVLGRLENIIINKISLKSKLDQGNLEFEEFLIDTSIGRLDIHGNMRLSENFGSSQLNIRVCFEPERDFATEREDIVGMLALLEKNGNEKCVPISGFVQKPEVKIPGINGPPVGGPVP